MNQPKLGSILKKFSIVQVLAERRELIQTSKDDIQLLLLDARLSSLRKGKNPKSVKFNPQISINTFDIITYEHIGDTSQDLNGTKKPVGQLPREIIDQLEVMGRTSVPRKRTYSKGINDLVEQIVAKRLKEEEQKRVTKLTKTKKIRKTRK